MTTRNNPYDGLIGLFRGAPKDDLALYDGIVVSTNPLRISAAGLELDENDIKTVAGLTLSAGDEVLLLTQDCQHFYLINKIGG